MCYHISAYCKNIANGGFIMLLSFSVENYKSFYDKSTFNLVPIAKQTGFEYSILKEKIGKNTYRALSSSIIYGPNASGKSNIISAIEVLKSIISRGHIRNDQNTNNWYNAATRSLEFIPNFSHHEMKPVNFNIVFTHENRLIDYSLSILLGKTFDVDFSRKIVNEELIVNGNVIFTRSDKVIMSSSALDNNIDTSNLKFLVDNINNNLNPTELFLTNGFSNAVNSKISNMVSGWFENKLIIIFRSDRMKINTEKIDNNQLIKPKDLDQVAIAFGGGHERIFLAKMNKSDKMELYTGLDVDDTKYLIPIDFIESNGTVRILNLFPYLKESIRDGKTIIIDEFDASIHPMVIMNLINIFHNDEINTKGAQLIFNTHNPIFLNRNLYRRDEIKFVEKDDLSGNSMIYSLADFKTYGENSVRKVEDYMKNYFINKYGAIRDVDLTELFDFNKDVK